VPKFTYGIKSVCKNPYVMLILYTDFDLYIIRVFLVVFRFQRYSNTILTYCRQILPRKCMMEGRSITMNLLYLDVVILVIYLLNQVVIKLWRIQTLWSMLKSCVCCCLVVLDRICGSLSFVIHPWSNPKHRHSQSF